MLSEKVVVGGGGTSWAVNVMDWPLPSSSVRALSPAKHRWVLVGTEVEIPLDGSRDSDVALLPVLANVSDGASGGGTTTGACGVGF